MRVLILGGDGMLGHQLLKHFSARHETRVTLHRELGAYERFGLFDEGNAYASVDVRDEQSMQRVFSDYRPQAVINAVGIVKQRAASREAIPSIEVNSLLPHRLALMCEAFGARLVHISTDCVFSGTKGHYRDHDPPDAEDLYGRTKYLGEVGEAPAITLRTSIIGPELSRKTGLLEWFLAQRGTIRGFTRAIFSGFTTYELARVIENLLVKFPLASGLYNVSSDAISKYDLLMLIKQKLGLAVDIIPHDDFACDRSLDSSRFRSEFGYTPPSWAAMIEELARKLERTSR